MLSAFKLQVALDDARARQMVSSIEMAVSNAQ
jgi:hypothetical protein